MTKNLNWTTNFDLGRKLFLTLLAILATMAAVAGNLSGTVLDKQYGDPMTGATIQIIGTTLGAVADMDGNYEIKNVPSGTYTIIVKYVGYKEVNLPSVKIDNEPKVLNFELESDAQALGEVAVVARVKRNTDVSMMTAQKQSLLVQSGVSAQQISTNRNKSQVEHNVRRKIAEICKAFPERDVVWIDRKSVV